MTLSGNRLWWLVAVSGILCGEAWAYEVETHAKVAEEGIASSPNLVRTLEDLGLDSVTAKLKDRVSEKTILDWLRQGAIDEDDTFSAAFARYRNHFFDPTPGAPNNGGFTGILPPLGLLSGLPGPDWSLEPIDIAGQSFSYRDARGYFLKGLTEPSKIDRERNLAGTFYALGHVVHVIEDMASPQHARNDPHAEGSLYEIFTNNALLGRVQNYTLTFSGGPAPAFSSVRDLWVDLARFSNRNFVTAGKGRNFRYNAGTWLPSEKYANPKPYGATVEVPIEQLPGIEPEIVAWCGGNCLMRFIGGKADDGNFIIPRAATFSIFTQDLSTETAGAWQVALNRYNFVSNTPGDASPHSVLIPRAVSYTAALYDYFFRGKIDIVPDPGNSSGHLIKNLGPEPMSGKFALYYDATDGSRKPVPDESGQPLVWNSQVILADTGGQVAPNSGLMAVAGFKEPADVKKPGGYMLVFVGDMGEEKAEGPDAIGVVAGRFIPTVASSEALYLAGLDAAGNYVGVKADKTGTKILRPGEFDPLRQFVELSQSPPGYVQRAHDDLIKMKQAVISQSITGPAYQTLAVTMRNLWSTNESGYVCCGSTQPFVATSGRV